MLRKQAQEGQCRCKSMKVKAVTIRAQRTSEKSPERGENQTVIPYTVNITADPRD